MRMSWLSTAAAAALLAGTVGAAAQVPAEKQQGAPSATRTLPDAGAPKRNEQAPAGAQSGSPGSSQGSTAERTKPEEQDTGIKSAQGEKNAQGEKPNRDQRKTTTRTNEKSPSSAAQPKDSKDAKDAAQSRDGDKQRASDRNRDNQRAGERDRDTQRAGDRDRDRDSQRAGERDQDGQRAGTRERDGERRDRADDASDRGERVQFSERERTTIRDSVDIERARVNVDINVNVGAVVPRSVDLRPLPAAIIDLNPRYRSYRYVVVENEIVIINPQTYTVVEVIPAGGSTQARATTRRGGGSVQLDTQQRQRILTYARQECQSVLTTDPDFDLAVGIRIPERIELCPFEDVVVREVGVVQPYRFFMVRDQVVLVDPSDHTIVEVIR